MKRFAIAALLALLAFPVLAQTQDVAIAPKASAVYGIAPVVTSTTGTSAILKSSPGQLYSVTAVNSTATAGVLMMVNATTVPVTGVLTAGTVLDCRVLPASGQATISLLPGPTAIYNAGIVALVSSAANCFTFTTSGGLTAFISGAVQ